VSTDDGDGMKIFLNGVEQRQAHLDLSVSGSETVVWQAGVLSPKPGPSAVDKLAAIEDEKIAERVREQEKAAEDPALEIYYEVRDRIKSRYADDDGRAEAVS
jgi:hypothetical protein